MEVATECVGSFRPNAIVVNTNAFAVDEEIHDQEGESLLFGQPETQNFFSSRESGGNSNKNPPRDISARSSNLEEILLQTKQIKPCLLVGALPKDWGAELK